MGNPGNYELIAAGVRRIADEQVNSGPGIFEAHAETVPSLSSTSTGGSFNATPAQTAGTGTASSGFVFSPTVDVFDPTEYFDVVDRRVVNEGTPYYPRYISVDQSNGIKLSWAAPVVDTAGRWLLTPSLDPTTNLTAITESLDSYLVLREAIDKSDPTRREKVVAGVVGHTLPAVSDLRNAFELNLGVTTDAITNEVSFPPELFISRKYAADAEPQLEVRADDATEALNLFSFVDTATLSPDSFDYLYYIQAVTSGQVEGLQVMIDPNYTPVDVKAGVYVIPTDLHVAANEVFALCAYTLNAGDNHYCSFELSAAAQAAGARFSPNDSVIGVPVNDPTTVTPGGDTGASWIGVKAPATLGNFDIIARSIAKPNLGLTVTVHVEAAPAVSIWGVPFRSMIKPTQTRALYGMVYGSTNKNIAWSVDSSRTTNGSTVVTDFGTVSPVDPAMGTMDFPVTFGGVTTNLRSHTTYTPPADQPTFKDGNYIFAKSQATPQATWRESMVLPSVSVDPNGGDTGGDFWFDSQWAWSGIEVNAVPGGYTQDAVAELTVNTTAGLTALNVYAIPIQDNFAVDPNGVSTGDASLLDPIIIPAPNAPYEVRLKIPFTGTLSQSFIMSTRNVADGEWLACSFVMQFQENPNLNDGLTVLTDNLISGRPWNLDNYLVIDPEIAVTATDLGPLPGSTWHQHRVTFAVTSDATNLPEPSVFLPHWEEPRYLVYRYTPAGATKPVLYLPQNPKMPLEIKDATTTEVSFSNDSLRYANYNRSVTTPATYTYHNIEVFGTNLDSAHVDKVFVYIPQGVAGSHIDAHELHTDDYELHGTSIIFKPRVRTDGKPGIVVGDLSTYIFEVRPHGSSVYPDAPTDYAGLYPHFHWQAVMHDDLESVGAVGYDTMLRTCTSLSDIVSQRAEDYHIGTAYPSKTRLAGYWAIGSSTHTGYWTTNQPSTELVVTRCVRLHLAKRDGTGTYIPFDLVLGARTNIAVVWQNGSSRFTWWVPAEEIMNPAALQPRWYGSIALWYPYNKQVDWWDEIVVTGIQTEAEDSTLAACPCVRMTTTDACQWFSVTSGYMTVQMGNPIPHTLAAAPQSATLGTSTSGISTVLPMVTEFMQ